MSLRRAIATTLLALASVVAVPKSPTALPIIELFIGSSRLSGAGVGEGRWTYFELLNDVTITQLGAVLDGDYG